MRIGWLFPLVFVPGVLFADEALEAPLLKLLGLYAENAGKLEACNIGPGEEGLHEHIEMMVQWKHPSWWDWVTGAKGNYREELTRDHRFTFSLNSLPPCERGLSLSASRIVLDSASASIKRSTRRDEQLY